MRAETDIPVIALDGLTFEQAIHVARLLAGRCYAFKIHDQFDGDVSVLARKLLDLGVARVFFDRKAHDIPRTVGKLAAKAARAGFSMFTVHASGGVPMMIEARKNFDGEIYAVTVLTSLDEYQAGAIYHRPIDSQVRALALLAAQAGVTGLVCSGLEVETLALMPELASMKFLVPGTRLPGAEKKDQARVTTPADALFAAPDRIHLVWARSPTIFANLLPKGPRIGKCWLRQQSAATPSFCWVLTVRRMTVPKRKALMAVPGFTYLERLPCRFWRKSLKSEVR
jgi:orotidine-5'-phosphate decarboxylase